MKSIILTFFLFTISTLSAPIYYSHNTVTYLNQSWMSQFDDGVQLRQMSILGTHSSMSQSNSFLAWGYQTQQSNLITQLNSGVRALDIRCNHANNQFQIYERSNDLGVNLDNVLSQIQPFLTSYPRQTVLVHIVQQDSPGKNSRTFQQTFQAYYNNHSSLIWNCTTQNPNLGMVRGKIVIIQQFTGPIYGLLYGTFVTIQPQHYGTNWDQYNRWLDIKAFINATNSSGGSRISFWTGYGGSYPYFCASGQSSNPNGAGLLATGMTTPGWASCCPDFPRVACFIGICTIAFQGINNLAADYIINNGFNYLGILFIDFYGDNLIQKAISLNQNLFGKCSAAQISSGCTCCNTKGVCLACNEQLNYVYNQKTTGCDAALGYYLNGSLFPVSCSIPMPGCLQCLSDVQCTLCDIISHYQLISGQCAAANGYYLDNNSIPQKCNLLGCISCSSSTVCTNCSIIENFVLNILSHQCECDTQQFFNYSTSLKICICNFGRYLSPNGTCDLMPVCPVSLSFGCLDCSKGNCSSCDAASGYYLSGPYCLCQPTLYFNGSECLMCNETQPACVGCITSQLCIQCLQNFTAEEGQCVCQPQYYMSDSVTCLPCGVGCLQCTSSTNCLFCNITAFFNLVNGLCVCPTGMFVDVAKYGQACVPCGAMLGCIDCNMFGCTQCDPIFGFFLDTVLLTCNCSIGYYVSPMAICEQCRMLGCIDCLNLTTCVTCNISLFKLDQVTKICLQICGDGILYNLECDDGNLLNGDGCSQNCTIQKYFTCSGGSSTSPSECSYSGPVTLVLDSYIKDINSNKVVIEATLYPVIPIFDTVNYSECFLPNFPIADSTVSYDPSSGLITYTFTYDKSLNTDTSMTIAFEPPQTLKFFYTPRAQIPLPYTTDNNLCLKSYPTQVYSLIPIFEKFTFVLMCLSCVVFLLGLFSSRLMAVEMIYVLQIAYVGLMTIDKFEALIYPFEQLWPVTGYNRLSLFHYQIKKLPPRMTVLGYKAYLLQNFNVNILIVLLPFIIGLILFAVYMATKNKKWKTRAIKSWKQWGISILLFAQVHLIASVFLNMKYGTDQILPTAIGFVLIVSLIIESTLLYFKPLNFGDYKQFFQRRLFQINFYLIVILFRFAVIGCILFFSQSIIGFCVGIALTAIEIILLIVFKPYKKNLRPIANRGVVMIILVAYFGYKFRITDELQWYTTYPPIILLIILIICVVGNAILMFLHRFFNSEKRQKVKKDLYFENMENTMDQQFHKQYEQWNEKKLRHLSPLKQQQAIQISRMNLLKQIRNDLKIATDEASQKQI